MAEQRPAEVHEIEVPRLKVPRRPEAPPEDYRGDDADDTDAEHRPVPADIIRHDPRENTAEYRTEGIATDVEPHGTSQAPGVDLFADIRHRNRRHTGQHHTLQGAKGDQHIEIRAEG